MPAFTTPVLCPTRLPGSPAPDQRESEEEVSNDLKYQSSDDSSSSSSSSSDEEQPPSSPPITTFPTVEQVVVYSTLPQEYSTLTFRGEVGYWWWWSRREKRSDVLA